MDRAILLPHCMSHLQRQSPRLCLTPSFVDALHCLNPGASCHHHGRHSRPSISALSCLVAGNPQSPSLNARRNLARILNDIPYKQQQ